LNEIGREIAVGLCELTFLMVVLLLKQRQVISRGIFSSVPDLKRKIMRFIRRHNKKPAPLKWSYRNLDHRINPLPDSFVTLH
jgi:hypothetical protein